MKSILTLTIQILFITSLFAQKVSDNSTDKVEISWKNPNHTEVDYIVLERSKNGEKFKAIKTIESNNNNGNTTEYNHTNTTDFKVEAYYRVKQVDVNGLHYFSNVVAEKIVNTIEPTVSLFTKSNKTAGLKNYEAEDLLVTLQNKNEERFVSIVNLVYNQNRLATTFTSEFLPTGDYIVVSTSDSRIYGKKVSVSGIRLAENVYIQSTK